MPKNEVSRKQLEANRRNARKSTGPRTPGGKARSSRNAIKHGLLAREAVIRSGDGAEDPAEFDALLKQLWDDCQPVGALEELEVERIAVCLWRLRRVQRFEVGAIRGQLDECGRPPVDREDRQPRPDWLKEYDLSPAHPPADEFERRLEEAKSGLEHAMKVLARAKESEDLAAPEEQEMLDVVWSAVALEEGLANADEFQKLRRRQAFTARLKHAGFTGERLREHLLKLQSDIVEQLRARVRQLESQLRAAQHYEGLAQERAALVHALPREKDVNKIIRYETMINRQLDRALNRLERLQRARLGDHVPAPVAVDLNVSGVKEAG